VCSGVAFRRVPYPSLRLARPTHFLCDFRRIQVRRRVPFWLNLLRTLLLLLRRSRYSFHPLLFPLINSLLPLKSSFLELSYFPLFLLERCPGVRFRTYTFLASAVIFSFTISLIYRLRDFSSSALRSSLSINGLPLSHFRLVFVSSHLSPRHGVYCSSTSASTSRSSSSLALNRA
jgi:hypothetical protein